MTSIEKDLADIRQLTRIALPESHTYVYRLRSMASLPLAASWPR